MEWISRIRNVLRLAELRTLRKLFVAIIGGTVVLIGVALIVLPGPAFIVIPAGLAILASEFAWARRAIRRGKVMLGRARKGNSSVRGSMPKSEKTPTLTNISK